MTYKGYIGIAEFDEDARVIRGEVVNTRDTITFHGKTADEVEAAFHDSVDDYLEFCKELGRTPEKPYSGRLLLRLTPEHHRDLTAVARAQGVSLTELVKRQLAPLIRSAGPRTTSAGTAAEGKARTKAKGAAKGKAAVE